MAEIETVKITELDPTSSANAVDQLLIRQGVTDKRISVDALKNSIISGATSNAAGVVQLNNTTNSTSTTQAATANAVRLAYNRGSSALTYAQGVNSALAGKANTNHTHDASQITTGVIWYERLPMGSPSGHGVVRIDQTNGGQSSQNGYVPSVERVNDIQRQLNELYQIVSDVESGVAFMPLPLNNLGDAFTTNFPIGTYILASAGPYVGARGARCYISRATPGGPGWGDSYLGQFAVGGSPSQQELPGIWLSRGAVGVFHNPLNKSIRRVMTSTGVEGVEPLNCAILCQRVA